MDYARKVKDWVIAAHPTDAPLIQPLSTEVVWRLYPDYVHYGQHPQAHKKLIENLTKLNSVISQFGARNQPAYALSQHLAAFMGSGFHEERWPETYLILGSCERFTAEYIADLLNLDEERELVRAYTNLYEKVRHKVYGQHASAEPEGHFLLLLYVLFVDPETGFEVFYPQDKQERVRAAMDEAFALQEKVVVLHG